MDATSLAIIQAATNLLALILSALAIIKYYLIPKHEREKWKSDTQKSDAEASKTFEEAAQLAANRANALENRLTKLEGDFRIEVDRLNGVIRERDMQIEQLVKDLQSRDEMIEQLKDWTERLVHQIQALGEEPVPFKRETRPRRGGRKGE